MTEAEAKRKWCPHMKGENGEGESTATCVGSDCMAWRWDITPATAKSLQARGTHGVEARGYCGLAGAEQ